VKSKNDMEVHMKKYLVLAIILGLFATPLLAQTSDMPTPWGSMNMMQHKQDHQKQFMMKQGYEGKDQYMGFPFWMAEELELTDTQIDKIDDYQDDSRKLSISLNADIDKLQIDEENAMQDENYKQARNIVDQIFLKKATLAKERITLKEKITSVLTEDQIAKIKSLHKTKFQNPPAKHPEWHK